MKNIEILDCTLRDGGSLNNWNFGKRNISEIVQKLNNAQIDVIEVGFIDNNAKMDENCALSPSNSYYEYILSGIENKQSKAFAMIDLSKYDFSSFDLTPSKNLDGIRIMFKKESLSSAISFARKLKKLNFQVSLNPVSITSYSKEELENFFSKVNDLMPNIVYIVDTYGLMNIVETLETYKLFNEKLDSKITIGYHSHNNLQLSFANAISILSQNDNRNVIIDSSLYGMGKRAGNIPTELIAQYLNANNNKTYDLPILLNVIENVIMSLPEQIEWGYSLTHYVAAINKCHSDYVSYLHNQKNYSYEKINNILKTIDENEKLTFNKKYIEEFIMGDKDVKQCICSKKE